MVENIKFKHLFGHVKILTIQSNLYLEVTFGTKWSLKPLKEFQFIWNFLWQDTKSWPFNTGDCLIEVTSWEGLTNIFMW